MLATPKNGGHGCANLIIIMLNHLFFVAIFSINQVKNRVVLFFFMFAYSTNNANNSISVNINPIFSPACAFIAETQITDIILVDVI